MCVCVRVCVCVCAMSVRGAVFFARESVFV
jgi:hypothetical protein